MTPLLATALIAAASAAATYVALQFVDRRTNDEHRVELDPDGAEDPPEPSLAARVPATLLALVIGGVVLGALTIGIERNTPVVRWDERVERWASETAGTRGTDVLRAITHLGDTVVVLSLALVFALVLLAMRRRRFALFTITVVVGQWALANLIKELVARARPALDPLATFSGYSFPSGHSTAAAATYLALALVLSAVRPTWNGPLLIATGVGVASAVAASRALLGVHWFSDVLGGLILGWTWCLACAWLFRVTWSRKGQRVVVA